MIYATIMNLTEFAHRKVVLQKVVTMTCVNMKTAVFSDVCLDGILRSNLSIFD